MKARVIFTALLMFGAATLSLAQPDRHHQDRQGDHHGDHYGDRHHSSYHYNSNRGHHHNSYVGRMSRKDRKRYKKLVRKLRERESRAWDDGYVSRRERRKIREIQYDLDRLQQKYSRRNSYAYYGSYGNRPCR